jgi:hypothetical protein
MKQLQLRGFSGEEQSFHMVRNVASPCGGSRVAPEKFRRVTRMLSLTARNNGFDIWQLVFVAE